MLHERYMRAALLYNQRRFADAERELRDLLTNDPEQPEALQLLAATFLAQNRVAEARSAAQSVLGISPASADAHDLLARIELVDENARMAEEHAMKAVELEPGDSGHYSTLAFVLLRRTEMQRALEAADRGLAINPEDLSCLNMRTEALARLGRKEEADRTIHKTLELDPENPYTHSNTGWAVLRRGDHKKALEHFREALRRDPMNQHAKSGLVEALKARYWLYRVFLGYMFWVSNLKDGARWALILGLYFGNRVLSALTVSYPALAPFIWPLIIAYLLFALSTWVMVPVSNLFLRLNKYGRYALDREETVSSTFTGVSLLLAIGGGIGYLATGSAGLLALSIFGLVMMIPLASMLGGKKKGKAILVGTAGVLAVVGLFGVAIAFRTGDPMNQVMGFFIPANVAYQFLANWVRQ
ncbi:MAG: tetratricopeptide repeat protein [Flavobacteriales bacterium]|nr:tetratricopeptide repeat protein [Flavobacteriales bacterium]